MRIINEKEDIDYIETKEFFERRAHKYNENNPYSVTMYQDNNSELVRQRNLFETEKIMSLVGFDQNSRVLDLACGIGRWADAIGDEMMSYVGIDFSEELIQIANNRKKNPLVSFLVGSATDIEQILDEDWHFNRILLIGILMYLNDEDVAKTAESVEKFCEKECRICIREPIGLEKRLTLKDFFSQELNDSYNAIYRTRFEIMDLIKPGFLDNGFIVEEEGFLFEQEELNNRRETAQYFFILSRS